MRQLFVAALLASSLWAQAGDSLFNQAPPAVDKALRERVNKYYDYFVKGEFEAPYDELVAKDSRKAYFRIEKRPIRDFKIANIKYNKDFTSATVTTVVGTDVNFRGNNMPVNAPIATTWKIDQGEWCWYMDQSSGQQSPMGSLKGGAAGGSNTPFHMPSAADLLGNVKVDRSEVSLSSSEESTGQIQLTNGLMGQIDVEVECEPSTGLEIKVDKKQLKKDEVATISFSYVPPSKTPKQSMTATIRVQPTNQAIPVRLLFNAPSKADAKSR